MRSEFVWRAGAIVALSFLAARFVEAPPLVEPLWKAAGIILLGLSAALAGAFLPALALFSSAAGDFFLELSPPLWIAGMAAFAIAHGFYIAAFLGRIRRGGRLARRWTVALAVCAVSIAMLVWFLPDMGPLAAPGIAYHFILTLMVVLSLLAPVPHIAPIGAVAFLASDFLIALGLYKGLGPYPIAIWLIYAASQILLAKGLSVSSTAGENHLLAQR